MFEFNLFILCLLFVFLDWDIIDVKVWVLDKFKCEVIVNNFEMEEVDGKILLLVIV